MGAWSYLDRQIEQVLREAGNNCPWPACVSRPDNASTAIGTNDEHNAHQAELVARAVGLSEVHTGKTTGAGPRRLAGGDDLEVHDNTRMQKGGTR